MSRTASTTIFIGDGEYTARLRIGELIHLQEATKSGPMEIALRLQTGEWRVQDVIETIRFGLIGSEELKHQEIARLLDTYVTEGYLLDYHAAAYEVILAALYGVAEEPVPDDESDEVTEGNVSAP